MYYSVNFELLRWSSKSEAKLSKLFMFASFVYHFWNTMQYRILALKERREGPLTVGSKLVSLWMLYELVTLNSLTLTFIQYTTLYCISWHLNPQIIYCFYTTILTIFSIKLTMSHYNNNHEAIFFNNKYH